MVGLAVAAKIFVLGLIGIDTGENWRGGLVPDHRAGVGLAGNKWPAQHGGPGRDTFRRKGKGLFAFINHLPVGGTQAVANYAEARFFRRLP